MRPPHSQGSAAVPSPWDGVFPCVEMAIGWCRRARVTAFRLSLVLPRRFVAAMASPGGGKNDIPNRLKRQFAIFHVAPPSPTAMNDIFGAIVAGRFPPAALGAEASAAAARLPSLTMDLWSTIQTKLLPTPAKFHYVFTLHDISKVGTFSRLQAVGPKGGMSTKPERPGAKLEDPGAPAPGPGGVLRKWWRPLASPCEHHEGWTPHTPWGGSWGTFGELECLPYRPRRSSKALCRWRTTACSS